jgi:hypothetical protein
VAVLYRRYLDRHQSSLPIPQLNVNNYLPTSIIAMSPNDQVKPSRLHHLASWATTLRYEDIPPAVIERTKDFFLDTIACTLGGRDHSAIIALASLTRKIGPSWGPCEIIPFPDLKTIAAFAAMINDACSHVVEQDDLHNSSMMMHPVRDIRFPLCAFSNWIIGNRCVPICSHGSTRRKR